MKASSDQPSLSSLLAEVAMKINFNHNLPMCLLWLEVSLLQGSAAIMECMLIASPYVLYFPLRHSFVGNLLAHFLLVEVD